MLIVFFGAGGVVFGKLNLSSLALYLKAQL